MSKERLELAKSNYDFFISYKWKGYSQEAEEMYTLARRRGYKVLIDHDWIDEHQVRKKLPDKKIAEPLLWALGSCKYVIFFETYAQMVMVANGPSELAKSWQGYELEQIKADGRRVVVLYHGGSPRVLIYGLNRSLFEYSDLKDALDKIAKAIKDPKLFEPSPEGGSGRQTNLEIKEESDIDQENEVFETISNKIINEAKIEDVRKQSLRNDQ
jgi:hypothetical protein